MAQIEERILMMAFENAKFKLAATDTMSILEKMKTSMSGLSFGKLGEAFSGREFSGIANSARGAAESIKMVGETAGEMGSLKAAATSVAGGFTALQAVGLGALASIGAKAVQVGSQLVNSFTLQPIMEGFKEYETKINAIARIQANTASKGTTMDDITATLDELNEYSDRTIYNFGEMTDAIAKFTTAGVDVKTAATSIKGLSNVAALAGATAAQSAHVNQQISQALGSGEVRLQDWMSVENAGMDGEAFKETLFQVGKLKGTIKTTAQDLGEWSKQGNKFRDTLADGWLTTDVLNDSLKILSNDLSEAELAAMGFNDEQAKALKVQSQAASGAAEDVRTFTQLMDTLKESTGSAWVGMFESMFGGLEESKKIFTGLNNTIGPMLASFPTAVSKAFETFGELGGRVDLFAGIKDSFNYLKTMLSPIKEAFSDVFGSSSGLGVMMANAAKGFADFASKLKPSETAMKNIKTVATAFFRVMKGIGGIVGGGAWTVLTAVFKTLGFALKLVSVGLEAISPVIEAIGRGFEKAADGAKSFRDNIGKLDLPKVDLSSVFGDVKMGSDGAASGIAGIMSSIMNSIPNIGETLGNALRGAGGGIAAVTGGIVDALKSLATGIQNINLGPIIDKTVDVINKLNLGAILAGLGVFLGGKGIGDLADGLGKFGGIAEGLSEAFKGLGSGLSDAGAGIKKLGQAEKLRAWADVLHELGPAALKCAIAVGIFALSMKLLSTMSWDEITRGVIGVALAIGMLVGVMYLIDRFSSIDSDGGVLGKIFSGLNNAISSFGQGAKLTGMGMALIGIGVALGILALSVKMLSTLSLEELAKGLFSVGLMMAMIGAFISFIKPQSFIAAAISMTLLAAGMLLLSFSVEKLGEMDRETLIQGLTAVVAALLGIALVSKLLNGGSLLAGAIAILLIAASIAALGAALNYIGSMDLTTLGTGLLAAVAAIAALSVVAVLLPAGQVMLASVSLLLMAAALGALGLAVGIIAAIDTGSMIANLTVMGLLVALMTLLGTVAPLALAGAGAMLAVGAAMLVFSASLMVLSIAIGMLSAIDLPSLGAALLVMVAALAAFGIAAAILAPFAPAMFTLAAGIAAIGLASMVVAASVFLLVGAFSAGAAAFSFLGTACASLVVAFGSLISGMGRVLAKFGEAGPKIRATFAGAGSWLVDAGRQIWNGLLKGLSDAWGRVERFMQDKIGRLKSLTSRLLDINSPSRVFMGFGYNVSEGLALGIKNNDQPIAESAAMAGNVISAATDTLQIHSPSRVFMGIGNNIGEGLAIGINNQNGNVAAAAHGLIDSVLMAFANNPLRNLLADAGATAAKSYEKEMLERQKSFEELESRLIDEISDSKDKEADYYDSVTDSIESQNDALEKNNELKGKSSTKKPESPEKLARKEAKDQRQMAKKKRDLDRDLKKRAENEQKLARLAEVREAYLRGEAIADATELGLKDGEHKVLSIAERYADHILAALKETKDKASKAIGGFEALLGVGKTIDDTRSKLRKLKTSFSNFAKSTNDRAFFRNLGGIGESLLGIAKNAMTLFDTIEKIMPLLAPFIPMLEGMLPQIVAVVSQFAPGIAATLSGGIQQALPQIVGAIAPIVGAIAGIGILLYDLGKDKKIVKFLKSIFDSAITFLKSVPERMMGFMKTIVKGFGVLLRGIPKTLPYLLKGITSLFVSAIKYLPQIIKGFVGMLLDLIVTVFETPALMVELGFRIMTAIVEGISAAVGGIIDLAIFLLDEFFKIFTNPDESLIAQFFVKLIKGLVNGFKKILSNLVNLGRDLGMAILDGIRSVFRKIADFFLTPFRRIKEAINRRRNPVQPIVDDIKESTKEVKKAAEQFSDGAIGIVDGVKIYRKDTIAASGQSVVNAIKRDTDAIASASVKATSSISNLSGEFKNASNKVKDLTSNLVADLEDTNPVIRPIVDTSGLKAGKKAIDSLNGSVFSSPSIGSLPSDRTNDQNGKDEKDGGTVINYTQNNYSPEALSTIDIYRNTRRQLDLEEMKGRV